MTTEGVVRLNGYGIGDGGVDDGGGVGHDTAALDVAEAVDESAYRPLNDRRRRKSQETERRPHDLAPTWVARRPALHAYRNTQCHRIDSIYKFN